MYHSTIRRYIVSTLKASLNNAQKEISQLKVACVREDAGSAACDGWENCRLEFEHMRVTNLFLNNIQK
jgi:hypothetical protein